MTHDQIEADRQMALCETRQRMIERGQLASCEPLPNDCAPGVPAISSDKCPSCGHRMSWYPARQAWICVREGCQ
jgi:hypothetical protein